MNWSRSSRPRARTCGAPVSAQRAPPIPDRATGAVIFALGSGSSRRSPCDRLVAAALNQAGLGTLLADLLTPEEELRRATVFDVRLLAARLTGITRWLRRHPAARGIPLGYFGASTGAAAALWAAAADPRVPIAAVVSGGGRPDLAGPQLASVQAPTLLIVGGSDEAVLDLNRQARQQLTCENAARQQAPQPAPPPQTQRSPVPPAGKQQRIAPGDAAKRAELITYDQHQSWPHTSPDQETEDVSHRVRTAGEAARPARRNPANLDLAAPQGRRTGARSPAMTWARLSSETKPARKRAGSRSR